jgi:hypothetical protein
VVAIAPILPRTKKPATRAGGWGIMGPMKYRKLRIAWSVAWGIVAVLMIALWVRSYWWTSGVQYWGSTQVFSIGVVHGSFSYEQAVLPQSGAGWEIVNHRLLKNELPKHPFLVRSLPTGILVYIPGCFPVMICSVLPAIPWIRWSKRFRVGTLLIATTLVAVGLGLVVWSTRG